MNNLKTWQISWAGAPLVDHWSFKDDSSNKEVVVFTNCDKVDIQLNKRIIHSLDRDSFSDGVIKAQVAYYPGELVAFAHYTDERGKSHVISDTLSTSYSAYALAMHPDQSQFSADQRVLHIATHVVDSLGVINPHSTHLVNYRLDGPGKIKVIDNGDPSDHTPYGSASKRVRKGKQLLVLQAGSEPGDLIVHASSDGLRSSKVKIQSKE